MSTDIESGTQPRGATPPPAAATAPGSSPTGTACRCAPHPEDLPTRGLHRCATYSAGTTNASCRARALVAAALADWKLLPLVDDAVMCVAELVGNAARHAGSPVGIGVSDRRVSVGVSCRRYSALFIEVGDDDPRFPVLPGSLPPAEAPCDVTGLEDGGRGLAIVDALADALWWRRTGNGGKVVLCRFDLGRYGCPQKHGRVSRGG
ncbi:ATP-binding protein [Streptomyces sp. HB2AG]|uniref:ATP-binding protein n=1 Tax=Streptomyces sp. HB2AG TaxID=2983400 RepID=UPI0022AAD88A|nr:ATP-binding protein [Streptomyces sp. HB2AG]MCZ2527235.1 ATP-binding protein [Streptomyces sp. HB2AG]